MWFLSVKVLEATFCVGVKTKRPTRNPVCIRETPVKVCGVCPRRQKIVGTAVLLAYIPTRTVIAYNVLVSTTITYAFLQYLQHHVREIN